MRIAVTGSTGLIGSALVEALQDGGESVVRLVRDKDATGRDEVYWSPSTAEIDAARLEGIDAAVHLAGENIMGRWTEEKKRRLYDSRVTGTRLLCEALAALEHPPRVLVSASAIGFYGDRGDEELTEQSAPGHSFLAEVCRAWEAATEPAEAAGIRVVHLRIGLVLARRGGALARMLPVFSKGFGGPIGNGKMYVSWIVLNDLVRAIGHCIAMEHLAGPVNGVAPEPVTNKRFTRGLARAVGRPAVLPAPAWALKLVLGQMAKELLLASARVHPVSLLDSGFVFGYPEVEPALERLVSP